MKGIVTFGAGVLLVVIGGGILMANGASDGEGICITISPQTLVLHCDTGSVSVHSNIALSLVDRDSVLLEGIAPYLVKADSRGEMVAKFDPDAVKAVVSPGEVTLTLTGLLNDGTAFTASDSITVRR